MTVYPAFLTPEMADWLNTRPRTMLTYDLVLQFVKRLNLDAARAKEGKS